MDHPLSAAELGQLLDSVRAHLEGDLQAPESSDGASRASQLPPARALLIDDVSAMAVPSGDQLEGLTAELHEILLSEPFRQALADVVGTGLKALHEQFAAFVHQGSTDAHAARATARGRTGDRCRLARPHLPACCHSPSQPRPSLRRPVPLVTLVPKVARLMPPILGERFAENSVAHGMVSAPSVVELCWCVFSAA